ncbi:IS3 family transposase [Myxococcus sp. SDU36]|uniref:IS3 family transposase n=1 Tax=Myxococcus sp. SDU36 TaxID=2831967 RepID=UPI0025434F1D|nr:IS3 family transposase [Myxococcus sp. SDU36]
MSVSDAKQKKSRRQRREFTREFKDGAVKLVLDEGKGIPEVARDLDLTESALRTWVERAKEARGEGKPGALRQEEREELARLRAENRQLRMERELLKKAAGLLREGDDVKFAFIHAQKAHFPIAFMCEQLEVSRSGYYAWAHRPQSARKTKDRELTEVVAAVHAESRRWYGSPRVFQELKARGYRVSRKRVARLMRQRGLRARARRRFVKTTDSAHSYPVAPNVLERDFSPQKPNSKWAGDITYIWTAEGWLYLAVVLDLFSRKVVGWAMSDTIDRHLVLSALTMALLNRPAPDLHHSDRGSQYASDDYRKLLEKQEIDCSMSRKGNCWDNAVVESFFSSLKMELVYERNFQTHEEARRALFEYIEAWYNRRRRHSSLGYVSPEEYERNASTPSAAA